VPSTKSVNGLIVAQQHSVFVVYWPGSRTSHWIYNLWARADLQGVWIVLTALINVFCNPSILAVVQLGTVFQFIDYLDVIGSAYFGRSVHPPFLTFLNPLNTSTQYITACARSSGTYDSSQTWTSAPGTPVSPCTAADLQASSIGLLWGRRSLCLPQI
jgi:hypothetical protein